MHIWVCVCVCVCVLFSMLLLEKKNSIIWTFKIYLSKMESQNIFVIQFHFCMALFVSLEGKGRKGFQKWKEYIALSSYVPTIKLLWFCIFFIWWFLNVYYGLDCKVQATCSVMLFIHVFFFLLLPQIDSF